jgi:hypothetical protein
MKNGDASTHSNGQPVYVYGGTGKLLVVKLASRSSASTGFTIALATQDVPNTGNGRGRYCAFGGVGGVPIANVIKSGEDSALWTEGAKLYLDSTPGRLTVIENGFYVGTITDKSGSNISIFVHPATPVMPDLSSNSVSLAPSVKAVTDGLALKRDKTEIGDAHGFVNPPNTGCFTLSNTGSSVTVTMLAAAGAYKINGTLYPNASGLSLTFTASLGQNTIVVTSAGLAVSPFDIMDLTKIPACTVNWDGTNVTLGDELHGANRSLIEHKKQHDTDGARWVSGFATTFGSSAANTFSSLSGVIRDEDRYHAITAKTSAVVTYRNAALTAMITDTSSTRYAKLTGTTTGIPYYDNNGVLTALGNNNYGIMWMYATNRKLPVDNEIIFVIGQGTYASIAAAQTASLPTLVGMSVAEWTLLYRVIIRNSGGALNFIQADDLRTSSTGPAVNGSGLTSLPASQIIVTPFDGITATDGQSALEQINANVVLNTSRAGRYDVVTTTSPTSETITLSKATKHLLSTRLTSSNSFTIALPADDVAYLNESILVFSIGASLPSITQPYFATPGTVSVTNNSNTFTGTGTLFLTYFKSGDSVRMPDGTTYTVSAVASNTSMTMTVVYSGTTASGLTLNRYAMWEGGVKPTLAINTSWVFNYEWNTIYGVTEIYVGYSQRY